MALLAAWIITPTMVILVSYVLESRKVSFTSSRFKGFIPGDYLLGGLFASSVALASELPATTDKWYQSVQWHIIVLVGAVAGCLLARRFLDAPNYTKRQMNSPSKLYHDFVLYAGYGYLMFVVAVPSVFLTPWSGNASLKVVALACFGGWIACLVYDQAHSPKEAAKTAHPNTWKAIWEK
jgi:hypothetical protein